MSMSISVYLCLSVYVYLCLSMSIYVYLCLSMHLSRPFPLPYSILFCSMQTWHRICCSWVGRNRKSSGSRFPSRRLTAPERRAASHPKTDSGNWEFLKMGGDPAQTHPKTIRCNTKPWSFDLDDLGYPYFRKRQFSCADDWEPHGVTRHGSSHRMP